MGLRGARADLERRPNYAVGRLNSPPEGRHLANTWQGVAFPHENLTTDGYAHTSARDGHFHRTATGIYDMIGQASGDGRPTGFLTRGTRHETESQKSNTCCGVLQEPPAGSAEDKSYGTRAVRNIRIPRKCAPRRWFPTCAPPNYLPALQARSTCNAQPVDTSTRHVRIPWHRSAHRRESAS
jgi:hypothetical protein